MCLEYADIISAMDVESSTVLLKLIWFLMKCNCMSHPFKAYITTELLTMFQIPDLCIRSLQINIRERTNRVQTAGNKLAITRLRLLHL